MDRSPPFHGGSTGSNPVGVTTQNTKPMNFIGFFSIINQKVSKVDNNWIKILPNMFKYNL
jgi:hypothetical protein